MPKSATKPSPVALVPAAPVLPISHALAGTIEERLKAFDQIAANMASLQLNGWDNVQKIKAACWLADGKGEHPAVFIENHYVLNIGGRLLVEPKWEYMVRKLKETVPGFRFKVLEEENDHARVFMTDGVDEHTVSYSMEDARRQGLLGRGGNAWQQNTREMCLKQAIKRCARRIGVGRGSLPWVDVEMVLPQDDTPAGAAAERAISEAVVIDDEPAGPAPPSSEGDKGADAPAREAGSSNPADSEVGFGGAAPPPASAAPPADPRVTLLSEVIPKMYGGKLSREVALQKVSFIYNEMQAETTGVRLNPPVVFARADRIGPAEAQEMIDWLKAREEALSTPADATREPAASPEPVDEPPPPEIEGGRRTIEDDYRQFERTVKRAQKLFGRAFVVDSPPGSNRFWFIDHSTFTQMGQNVSIKLMIDGEIIISQPDLQQLNRILSADCDAAERGGR